MSEQKKFKDLGTIILSQKLMEACVSSKQMASFLYDSINRYMHCDWGDKGKLINDINNAVCPRGWNVIGFYIYEAGKEVCIETNPSRDHTFIYFGDEANQPYEFSPMKKSIPIKSI